MLRSLGVSYLWEQMASSMNVTPTYFSVVGITSLMGHICLLPFLFIYPLTSYLTDVFWVFYLMHIVLTYFLSYNLALVSLICGSYPYSYSLYVNLLNKSLNVKTALGLSYQCFFAYSNMVLEPLLFSVAHLVSVFWKIWKKNRKKLACSFLRSLDELDSQNGLTKEKKNSLGLILAQWF